MERVPEPELMLDAEQAHAYASADFDAPHRFCIDVLGRRLPDLPARGRALDLGCGPGDVTLRLARALPDWRIDALDGSPAMLDLARVAATKAGIASVAFHALVLPHGEPPQPPYELLFSNSLLHHLADPAALWSLLPRWGRPGSSIFVMDLLRPASGVEVRMLVEQYAAAEPEVLRRDFANSLRAAYRPAEVGEQLGRAGLAHLSVEIVTDRHFIVFGRL